MRVFFIGSYKDKPTTGGHMYNSHLIEAIRSTKCNVTTINVHQLPKLLKIKFLSFIYGYFQYAKRRPNLVIQVADTALRYFLFSVLLYAKNIPVIMLVYHVDKPRNYFDIQRKVNLYLMKYSLRKAKGIIVISGNTKKEVVKLATLDSHSKIVVINPGINTRFQRGMRRTYRNRKNWNIISIGAVIERKGYHYLLDALKNLSSVQFKCYVVGNIDDEKYYSMLRKKVVHNRLQGKIEFAGYISGKKLQELFDQGDLFVSASLHEGYGIVFGEAMCQGFPIIATHVGAVPEIIENEVTGLLIQPHSAVAIEKALKRLISNPKLAEELSLNAIKKCQHLANWRTMRQQVQESVREIIELH